MSVRWMSLCAALMLMSGFVVAADAEKFSAKCIVAGKPDAKEDKFSAFRSAKVFFCCDNCKAKFDAEPAKFEVAANHQLAVTGQYKQAKCPLSGGPIDAAQTVEVAGVKVAFCCENCQGKASAASADEQKQLLFNTKAFDKAFVLSAKK